MPSPVSVPDHMPEQVESGMNVEEYENVAAGVSGLA